MKNDSEKLGYIYLSKYCSKIPKILIYFCFQYQYNFSLIKNISYKSLITVQ